MKKLFAFLLTGFIFMMACQVAQADPVSNGPPGISIDIQSKVILDNPAAVELTSRYCVELSPVDVYWPPGEVAAVHSACTDINWIGQYSMGNLCNWSVNYNYTIEKPSVRTWYFTAVSKAS